MINLTLHHQRNYHIGFLTPKTRNLRKSWSVGATDTYNLLTFSLLTEKIFQNSTNSTIPYVHSFSTIYAYKLKRERSLFKTQSLQETTNKIFQIKKIEIKVVTTITNIWATLAILPNELTHWMLLRQSLLLESNSSLRWQSKSKLHLGDDTQTYLKHWK